MRHLVINFTRSILILEHKEVKDKEAKEEEKKEEKEVEEQ